MADDDRKADEGRKRTAQQQLTPNAEGNVMVDVIMGPYRNSRLTMTAADGQAAINGHWAVAPNQAVDPDHEPHDPLSDQERNDAMAAAHAWAQATWDKAQGTAEQPPPPEGGEGGLRKRDMEPERGEAYKTRQAQDARHPEPPKHPEHQKR